eukprot:gene9293-1561_t
MRGRDLQRSQPATTGPDRGGISYPPQLNQELSSWSCMASSVSYLKAGKGIPLIGQQVGSCAEEDN